MSNMAHVIFIKMKRLRFLKNKLKTTFKIRTGKKSPTEKLVSIMGWTHLVLIFLAIPLKLIRLLYFMSAGWAAVLRTFIGVFSRREFPVLTTLNNSGIVLIILGATYSLYHIILIALFLGALRKGANISTYFWGILSIIILVNFTIIGCIFEWT
jgi:hypothetical protein